MTHGFSNWCSDDDRCDVTVPHPSGVPVPCARPVDHPIHRTAAAPTEQATEPAEDVCEVHRQTIAMLLRDAREMKAEIAAAYVVIDSQRNEIAILRAQREEQ